MSYGKGSKVLWEKFPDGRTVCYWYRDAAGFCLLGRCLENPRKPCPKTQAQADKAREALVEETIRQRDSIKGKGAAG
jgi:hypothetical protein